MSKNFTTFVYAFTGAATFGLFMASAYPFRPWVVAIAAVIGALVEGVLGYKYGSK